MALICSGSAYTVHTQYATIGVCFHFLFFLFQVDFCANKPCPEGHRCIDHGNDFSCECPGGRNGPDCNQMPRTVSHDLCTLRPPTSLLALLLRPKVRARNSGVRVCACRCVVWGRNVPTHEVHNKLAPKITTIWWHRADNTPTHTHTCNYLVKCKHFAGIPCNFVIVKLVFILAFFGFFCGAVCTQS